MTETKNNYKRKPLQVVPPVETRANIVKALLSDTENLKVKLENKDEDLKELKKHLKLKVS